MVLKSIHSSFKLVMTSRTICITLLASEWKSSKGGLSTMNRELAIQFALLSNTSVSFFVPKCSDEDKREAKESKVKIVEADKRPGYEPIDWLAFPPKDLVIDFVVGHGVKLGKQAQIIRDSHQCKWMQVVHTAPDELSMFKNYPGAIPKGEEKQWDELELCKMADLCVAVGPKLMETYKAYLNFSGQRICNFTPGIFDQLSSIQLSSPEGRKFRVLVFGRGDTEDFELKGYDIAAKAVALLDDKTYHLTFVGASKGSESHVTEKLLKHGLFRSQLIVKGYLENREGLMTLLCASNLVIIPSRTEGFGLTALEALSAGVPFLVSQNSGFGEALQEIGSAFIVDSEDPEDWAEAIKAARQKGSETAFQECRELRTRYSEKYSWQTQCDELFRMMRSLIHEIDDPNKKQTSEYQPKQNIQQESSIRFSGTVAKSATPRTSEIFTSLPERQATKESVERPIKEVPEKSTATPTSQGARPKESNSVTTESAASRGRNKREVYTEKEDVQSGKAGESTRSRNERDAPKLDSLSLANKPTDLSIIGCNASQESLWAVKELIDRYSDVLDLITEPKVLNLASYQMKSYFEHKPSTNCVLVADTEKIKAVLIQEGEIILKLLQNVAEKIVLTICYPRCGPEREEPIVRNVIKAAFNDNKKVYITWFKNGKLVLNEGDLINFLTSPNYVTNTSPQEPSAVVDSRLNDITGRLLSNPLSAPWDFQVYLPSGKTVLVLTRLHNGKISLQAEDVKYWKPGFVVPREIVSDLTGHSKISNTELVILLDKEGCYECQVDEKKEKGWHNFMLIGLEETIVMQTKLKRGQISFEYKDLLIHNKNFRVPKSVVHYLQQTYRRTSAADLFFASDSMGNSRCIVKVGNDTYVCHFINPVFNQAAGKKSI